MFGLYSLYNMGTSVGMGTLEDACVTLGVFRSMVRMFLSDGLKFISVPENQLLLVRVSPLLRKEWYIPVENFATEAGEDGRVSNRGSETGGSEGLSEGFCDGGGRRRSKL